jgi:putative inorganic carbon (hco3(-)) transporter
MIFFYWLIWVLPLTQHPIWGQTLGPLTIFEYMGILCLLYAIVHLYNRRVIPPFLATWEVRLFLLLYVIEFFSALSKGNSAGASGSPLTTYTSSVFLIFITISIVDTLPRLRWTVLTLVGSYGFASLYLIREWQQGHQLNGNFRPGWIVGDANYFSTSAIFAMLLAFSFMQGRRPRWEKAYCAICLLLTLLAVTFCASRGGFLGLMAGLIVLLWHSKHRVRNLVLMGALLLPLSLALPMSPLHRFLDPSTDYGSTDYHLEAWKAGLHMIAAHPIVGIGLGNFKPLMTLYVTPGSNLHFESVAHNMFVEVAAELGVPALIIFIGIFVFTYRTLGTIRRSPATHHLIRETASALQAGLVGFAVAGSFVSAETEKTSWMGFAVMFCLMPLARSQRLAKRVEREVRLPAAEGAAFTS